MFFLVGKEWNIILFFTAALVLSVCVSVAVPVREASGTVGVLDLFTPLLCFTAVLVFLIFFFPVLARIFLRIIGIFAVFLFTFYLFSFFFPQDQAFFGSVSVLSAYLLFSALLIRNIVTCLSVAGAACTLSMFITPEDVISFSALLSVYDFISVFVTKHMLRIAEFFGGGGRGELRMLGTGDIAVPALLSASLSRVNIMYSIFSSFGAIFGVVFTFYLLKRYGRPLPALPPIIFFQLFFTLLSILTFS